MSQYKKTFIKNTAIMILFVFPLVFSSYPTSAQAQVVDIPAGTRIDYPVGNYPVAIAFDNATRSVWIANQGSETISKVDVNTGEVKGEYPTGLHPYGVAFANSNNSVWVTNSGSQTITKLDAISGDMIGEYQVGLFPIGVAFDSVNNSIWVANSGTSTISKLSAETGDKEGEYTVDDFPNDFVGAGPAPVGLAFDNLNNIIWVTNQGRASVVGVDINTGNMKYVYPVGDSPTGIAFDPVTNSVWVANQNSNTISRIDIITGERLDFSVGSTETNGSTPINVVFDDSTNSVWVTNYNTDTVSKVDINTGTATDYDAGFQPHGATFDSITKSVWVTNYGSHKVSKIAIGKPWGASQPQSFWAQVQNAPNSWKIRNTPGTQNKPIDDVIKTVPNDWVLRVATTTDASNNPIITPDGYQWYGVEDVTDGAVGWMAAKDTNSGTVYLANDASNQTALEAKATSTPYQTKEARIPVILDAVNNYYTASTTDSLYSDKGGFDGNNNFQKYIQGSTFPQKLVLAIASTESGGNKFDNEGCSSAEDGGIGIMQITSSDSKGVGSALKNYSLINDCQGSISTSEYYSDSLQGIFANVKDGFRTLQDKFAKLDTGKNQIVGNITVEEMKAISTVYRYNQGSPYKAQSVESILSGNDNDFTWNEYLHYSNKKMTRADGDVWMNAVRSACSIHITLTSCLDKINNTKLITSAYYLRDVGLNLKTSPFGATYEDSTYGDKLIAANNSQVIVFLRSPAELMVINSAGETTGSVIGEPKEEIANSIYDPEQKFVTILFPQEQYKYRVVGLETGEYGLSGYFVNNGEFTPFDADNIPITQGEVHDYTIDQSILSRCGLGAVTLSIDYQGDGIVDKVISGTCRISMGYNIKGFLPPVKMDGTGIYNKGRTLPVKFKLRDVNGKLVSSAKANLFVSRIVNGVVGPDEIPGSSTCKDHNKTKNQFKYDKEEKQYIYNLSTDSMSRGKWQIKAVLDNGQEIKAVISLK